MDGGAYLALAFQARFQIVIKVLVDPTRDFRGFDFDFARSWGGERHPSAHDAAIHAAFQTIAQPGPECFERCGFYKDRDFAAREVVLAGATNEADSNGFV